MQKLLIPVLMIAAGVLVGCGEPAPSVPIAPEQKLPDTSKMSPEEIQKLRGGGGSATPADRGG